MTGYNGVLENGFSCSFVSKAELRAALAQGGAPAASELGIQFPEEVIREGRYPLAAAAARAATLLRVERSL